MRVQVRLFMSGEASCGNAMVDLSPLGKPRWWDLFPGAREVFPAFAFHEDISVFKCWAVPAGIRREVLEVALGTYHRNGDIGLPELREIPLIPYSPLYL
jgi:hypothetical protein